MLGYKIHTIIASILTNHVICDLLREGNEDAKNTEKIDILMKPLYEKYPRNSFDGPSMQELQSGFLPSHRNLESPLILSIAYGIIEGLNDNRGNALVSRHPEYRAPNQNHEYKPFSYVPYYNSDSNVEYDFIHWMVPSYSMRIGFGRFKNLIFPAHFMMTEPPEIKYTGPVLSSEMKDHNLDSPSHSPHIEILKSIGYELSPDISTYHPITYAKDYFIDVPSPSTTKPHNYDTQSFLLGELEYNSHVKEHNEKQTVESYEFDNPSDDNPSLEMTRPSQYYYSNTKPITFEQRMREPKNIYEIISAEKIIPKEIDMRVHIKRHQMPYTNWKPIIASGNMAEGSDVIAMKSPEHENVTAERNYSIKENSAASETVPSDLEILLTGEAVERVETDDETFTKKYGNENESTVKVLTGEEMERLGDLKTETEISVVSISESENATSNIIDR